MKAIHTIILFISLFVLQLSSAQTAAELAKQFHIRWTLTGNNHQNKEQAAAVLEINNAGNTAITSSGWKLYFNYNRPILSYDNSKIVSIKHLNGDLFECEPLPDFQIKPQQKLVINFISEGQVLNPSAAPSGLYLVLDKQPETGVNIENYQVTPIVDSSVAYSTPQSLFEKNRLISSLPTDELPLVFPTPKSILKDSGSLVIHKQLSIQCPAEFLSEARYMQTVLQAKLSFPVVLNPQKNSGIAIQISANTLPNEAYELRVSNQNILLAAGSSAGVFYGIQSLLAMLPVEAYKQKQTKIILPCCRIQDAPRFAYRGFMLDVARNFQPMTAVKKLIDWMALYKMNTLHFHFSDDEGWRIAIPGLPELTDVGAQRGHTLKSDSFLPAAYGSGPQTGKESGSGYYTREEFIELLQYATQRHVQVIPEIESPGHSRAAIKSMDFRYEYYSKAGNIEEAERYFLRDPNDQSTYLSAQLWTDNVMCVAKPAVYRFLDKVITELQKDYQEANAPLTTIHLGGDEVPKGAWEKSPLCTALLATDSALDTTNDLWYYYFEQLNLLMRAKKLNVSGWEEIAMRKTMLDGHPTYIPNPDFANQNFHPYVWNNGIGWGSEDLPYVLANAGYKVILSCVSHLYFDLAYDKASDELGYYWGGFNDIDKIFGFIPLDYYKNTKEDTGGNPIDPKLFENKTRLTDYGAQNIQGIQGQLFAENVRNTSIFDYLLVPKLQALAERAWAPDPEWSAADIAGGILSKYNKDWSIFVNTLSKKVLPKLDYEFGGMGYRIPPVGAVLKDGMVVANCQMPGFAIRYTTNGTEPKASSSLYQGPIATKGPVILAAFNGVNRKGKSTRIINK